MSRPETEPVLSAPTKRLRDARALLATHGISSRHSSPKRADGLLRVAPAEAERARELIAQWQGSDEGIMPHWEALYFVCFDCGAALQPGVFYCPRCHAVVGDPHGM
jgi:hypothetical protein